MRSPSEKLEFVQIKTKEKYRVPCNKRHFASHPPCIIPLKNSRRCEISNQVSERRGSSLDWLITSSFEDLSFHEKE